MNELPNLAGVATAGLVQSIGTGTYAAAYINWARTMHLLREHAPGWLPVLVTAPDGGIVHSAPVGGFLLIRFQHLDGTKTPAIPQAIMDNRNAAIPSDKITARDITDTHRRGACLAAALTFGLAYELWAKMPLESGYVDEAHEPALDHSADPQFADWRAAIEGCATKDELATQWKAMPKDAQKALSKVKDAQKAKVA